MIELLVEGCKSLADVVMQFKSSKSHDSVHMTSSSFLLMGQSSYNFPVVSSINLSLF